MTTIVSPFILRRVVASPEIHYIWDDWNTELVEEPPNKAVVEALTRISFRGLVAFATSTAEWILARFIGLLDTTLPESFVEAAWVAQIDRRYLAQDWEDHPDADEDNWRGPIRGPIGNAMTELMYAGQQAESMENPELQVGWMTNLAAHVLVDPQPYIAWRKWILAKFQTEYPRSSNDAKGSVVPRETCDPDAAFAVNLTEGAINALLARARAGKNPFLNSPEALKSLKRIGFDGQPYLFDQGSDRTERMGEC